MNPWPHITVLRDETVAAIQPVAGETYVDLTLGMGGHAEALLSSADCRVIGIDRDEAALEIASRRLAGFGSRFLPLHGAFGNFASLLDRVGVSGVNGAVADLGVSSLQLDTPERGFSFRFAGPVDMRMDSSAGTPALDLVHSWDEGALASCIADYGEERFARRIAAAIVAGRPYADTLQLAEVISAAVPGGKRSRIHPATRTFQALRIAVNDELGELERMLPAVVDRLLPGGRVGIITFHSLEDRIVKRFFARESGRDAPRDPYGNPLGQPRLAPPRSTTPSEDDPNPRARSARLRSAVRLS
jgi:16S rRNA (cytosine1402-N4)-methyltransferase